MNTNLIYRGDCAIMLKNYIQDEFPPLFFDQERKDTGLCIPTVAQTGITPIPFTAGVPVSCNLLAWWGK